MFAPVINAGVESNMFSVEVVYNGFFCGLRDNLEYVVHQLHSLIIALVILGHFRRLMKFCVFYARREMEDFMSIGVCQTRKLKMA